MLNSISSSNSDFIVDKESNIKYDKLEETINALCTAVQAIEECNLNQSKCIISNTTDINNLKNWKACDSLTKNTIDVNDLTADNVKACTTTTNNLTTTCVKSTNVKSTNVESHNINASCLTATNITSSSITSDNVNSCQIITPKATIESATIETLNTPNFNPGSITTTTLTTDIATIEEADINIIGSRTATMNKATINDLNAEEATIVDATIAEKDFNSSVITLQKYLTVQSTTDLEITTSSFTVIKNGKTFNIKNALGNVVAIYDDSDTLTVEFSKSGNEAKIRWIGNEPVSSEIYSATGKNVFDLVAANSSDITVIADYSFLACINDKVKGNTWDSICVDTICSYRNNNICLYCPVEATSITLDNTLLKDDIITIDNKDECICINDHSAYFYDKTYKNSTCICPDLVVLKCSDGSRYEACMESDHLCIKNTRGNCYIYLSENELCFNQSEVDSLKLTKEGNVTGVTCINVCDKVVIQPGSIVTKNNCETSRLQSDIFSIDDGDGHIVCIDNTLGFSATICNDDYLSTAHFNSDSLCFYAMDRTTGNSNNVEIDVCCASLPATDVNGDLCVTGDFYQTGCSYTTHAEDLNVNCCLITTRSNATAAMASTECSGLKVCMGLTTADDLYIVAKNDGQLYIGKSTSLQPLATRTNLTDGCFIKYDATNKTLVNADNPKPDYSNLTKGCLVCYDGNNLASAPALGKCVDCAGILYSTNHSWTSDELYTWLSCGTRGCVACAVTSTCATSAKTATYATNDQSGNNISSCYAKKSDKINCACKADYATYATNDQSGNNISSCYAKKTSSCCTSATNMYGYVCSNTLYLFNC